MVEDLGAEELGAEVGGDAPAVGDGLHVRPAVGGHDGRVRPGPEHRRVGREVRPLRIAMHHIINNNKK